MDFEKATPPEVQNIFKESRPIGRIQLGGSPLLFDPERIAREFFPEGKYLKATNGNEYIFDKNGKTIVLFENRQEEGFGSIYSPLTPSELKTQLARLPEEYRQKFFDVFGITDETPVIATKKQQGVRTLTFFGLKTVKNISKTAIKEQTRIEDLPEDYFLTLSEQELQRRKQTQWEAVKDLDDNDPRKIVYFRRFTNEFKSQASFNPELIAQSGDGFRYYVPDVSKLNELPKVEPLSEKIDIPDGKKIGFVIGYHHLEKPWGRILMDALQKQIDYDSSQVEFILIENKDIPTGEHSLASEREIQEAIQESGITHLIDIHEQLSQLNHYMNTHLEPEWREGGRKNPKGQEYTLDPFVPAWMIEQYYQGKVYPQLQYAINDQLKVVVSLVKKIKKTQ